MKPKKNFYTFKEGQELPKWLGAWKSTANSPAKKRELSFKNRSAKIYFNCGCTVSIHSGLAVIRPIKNAQHKGVVIVVQGLNSAAVFGLEGMVVPHIIL